MTTILGVKQNVWDFLRQFEGNLIETLDRLQICLYCFTDDHEDCIRHTFVKQSRGTKTYGPPCLCCGISK